MKTATLIPISLLPADQTVIVRAIQGRAWAAPKAAVLAKTKWANSIVTNVREGLVLWVNAREVSAIKSMGN